MFQKKVVGKIKTHILFQVTLFYGSSVTYEIMWVNMVEPDRPQMIQCMHP